jgi:hypothetical protein|tara:strand:- start:908 stop:2152 length:1245 start_codon:yes stop_codon:yes gene_type:complete
MSNDTLINPAEIKNKWVKVDGVPLSMYTNDEMTDKVYWGYKREYGFGLVNVGTPCNTKCFYCSQYWNPPEIIIVYGNWLTLDEIKHFLTFVPDKHIYEVGYGHHISNGEFFAHPHATEILKYFIEEDFVVKGLDTNGHFVNEEQVKLMKILLERHTGRGIGWDSGKNVVDEKGEVMDGMWWGLYLHLTNYEKTKHCFELLDKHDVPYAVVIVPTLVDLENGKSEEWIRLLNEEHNPSQIEISHPAYTKYAPPNVVKHLDFTWDDGWEYIKKWQKKYPKVKIDSENRITPGRIDKSLNDLLDRFKDVIENDNPKMLFLISESVKEVFETHVKKIIPFDDYKIQMVKNTTFGGNIIVAGLLLVQDYIPIIEQIISEGYIPDLIVLPKDSFFFDELDLTGVSVHTITEKFGIKVVWC